MQFSLLRSRFGPIFGPNGPNCVKSLVFELKASYSQKAKIFESYWQILNLQFVLFWSQFGPIFGPNGANWSKSLVFALKSKLFENHWQIFNQSFQFFLFRSKIGKYNHKSLCFHLKYLAQKLQICPNWAKYWARSVPKHWTLPIFFEDLLIPFKNLCCVWTWNL